MFCRFCGKQISEDHVFCPFCGKEQPGNPNMRQSQSEAYEWDGYITRKHVQTQKYEMIWHKCLVYFVLWVSAFADLVNALTFMVGQGQILSYISSQLRLFAIALGVVELVLAILCVVTAVSLMKYKANGPNLLVYTTMLYIGTKFLLCVLLFVSLRDMSSFFLSSAIISEILLGLIMPIVMLIVNHKYYQKREDLFVN